MDSAKLIPAVSIANHYEVSFDGKEATEPKQKDLARPSMDVNAMIGQPDQFRSTYTAKIGDLRCYANLFLIGSSVQVLILPALVGLLLHYLEEKF